MFGDPMRFFCSHIINPIPAGRTHENFSTIHNQRHGCLHHNRMGDTLKQDQEPGWVRGLRNG